MLPRREPRPSRKLSRVEPPRSDLAQKVYACLEPRAEVLEAYLFGSQATGATHPGSDVDVAVYLDRAARPQGGFGPEAELGADLMRALGRSDVDVVVLNRAGPMLYHRVLRDGVRVLSRDLKATTTREGYALSRYLDWQPRWRKIEAALGERLARAAAAAVER